MKLYYLFNRTTIISIIFILLIVGLYYYYNSTLFSLTETFNVNEDTYTAKILPQNTDKIPLNIFQTWKTFQLPPKMKKCVESIKHLNPNFTHHLYDDNMCRNFIIQYYHKNVIDAYDKLNPGAYKADLWRYCILYIKGGIYLDIKYQNCPGFNFIDLIDNEHYVKDIPQSGSGVYNALMICRPGNPTLLKSINKIINNTKSHYYGENPLSPTGPLLLKTIFSEQDYNYMDMHLSEYNSNTAIFHNNKPILVMYPEYRREQNAIINYKSYANLWRDKEVYDKN
tara:strand:- start:37 stop:882 length:846 start_codon:yes stop_codon:yes gene_type:complete